MQHPVLSQAQNWALVFFLLQSRESKWCFLLFCEHLGPEFKSLTIKYRFRAGERQKIIYDYQMHQFYWFGMAICNLPLQEETSNYLTAEHREITTKLLLCSQRNCSKYFHKVQHIQDVSEHDTWSGQLRHPLVFGDSDQKAPGPPWRGRMDSLVQCVSPAGPTDGAHCAFRSLVCAGIPTHCSSFSVCFTAHQAVCGISLCFNKTIPNKNQIFVRFQNSG